MKNKKVILAIAAAIIVIIILIIAAVIYLVNRNKNNNTAAQTATDNLTAQAPGGGNFANFTYVMGKVNSLSAGSLIVDTSNGQGQRIVTLSSTANITKYVDATMADVLIPNQNVMVNLTSDNNTAVTITLALARPNRNPASAPRQPRTGAGGAGGVAQNPNTINGMILSIDGNQVTISSMRNSNKTININSSTKYKKQIPAVLSDIIVGANITVIGTASSAGTVIARNINVY